MRNIAIKFDGACWPNPGGDGGYGYEIFENGQLVNNGHGFIEGPHTSNNYAEFFALYQALECLSIKIEDGDTGIINVYGDSQFTIRVMDRRYHPRKDKIYYSAYLKCKEMVQLFKSKGFIFSFNWIPRESNQSCDNLSKKYLQKS